MDSEKRWVVEKTARLKERAEEYIEKINQYIRKRDEASVQEMIALFTEEKAMKECIPYFESLHFAYIIVQITLGEQKNGKSPLFLQNGRSIDELEIVIKTIKFAVWRMEFSCGEDRGELFNGLFSAYALSVEALHQIILLNALNPKKAYLSCVEALLENGDIVRANDLLHYAAKAMPEDIEIRNLIEIL